MTFGDGLVLGVIVTTLIVLIGFVLLVAAFYSGRWR